MNSCPLIANSAAFSRLDSRLGGVLAQIEECTIDFNSKIGSMLSAEVGMSNSTNGTDTTQYSSSAAFKAQFASQRTEKNSNSETREFSMSVHVKAVQADMPAGTVRLLQLLEDAIFQAK